MFETCCNSVQCWIDCVKAGGRDAADRLADMLESWADYVRSLGDRVFRGTPDQAERVAALVAECQALKAPRVAPSGVGIDWDRVRQVADMVISFLSAIFPRTA